ncbi:MAG: DNA polymerase III subunit delta, partial [Alphaproteobacteria bacterium]
PDDPFRFAELTAASIRGDAAMLVDEALARAFGGGRRVVLVTDAADGVTDAFRELLSHPALADPDCALVLARAGELAARSSLRKLFESAENAAALACYADEEEALARLVGKSLVEAGLSASPEIVDAIAARLGPDRLLNRREVEKLVLYVGDTTEVGLDDVSACLGDSVEAAIDDAVMAATDGDYRLLDRTLDRAWSEGISPVAILRAGQRHLQRLHLAGTVAGLPGKSLDAAMASLRPPVFFKLKARFRQQVQNWPRPLLEQAMGRLSEAESLVKTTGTPDRAACGRALLALAQMARTAARR